MSDTNARRINPHPEHRRGLWSVRAVPYLHKDRWAAAPFGDRWRALKARMRAPASRGAAGCGRQGGGV